MKIEFLNSEMDKLGNEIKIFRTDQLGMSPIYTFFLRQMAELIDKGFGTSTTSWDDKTCGAVYAEQDGKILGHIVYDTSKPGHLWITLSAVDETCRGRGIYTILHKYFEQTAKEKDCKYISSYVHVKNFVRQQSAEKVGMKPLFYYMIKKI
jgi:GNAT superfamily N-acetyltransferase